MNASARLVRATASGSDARGPRARALLLGAALSFVLGCDGAAEPAPPPVTQADLGASLFSSYCTSCHGRDARGDGPAANALAASPKDLTRLSGAEGDRFRADTVAASIDGRRQVEAHGPREMPVWGRVLDDRNTAAPEELRLTPDMIQAIVAYLQSIQRTPTRPE